MVSLIFDLNLYDFFLWGYFKDKCYVIQLENSEG